ncbi:glycosyltransferase [Comamonas endophytica]
MGIRVVRESIGWRLFDEGGAWSMPALREQARLAARHGIQVIWSLMHYGWPQRLDPFERPEEFIAAFAEHCETVAAMLAEVHGPAAVYQPINEISFLAWAAGHTGLIHPYVPGGPERGAQLKRVLVRATLRAIDAIWRVAPGARIVHTDPAIHVEAPLGAGPGVCAAAAREAEGQFEAWDMICGLKASELGGAPRYLDVLGINYYHDNQWEHGSGARLHWHLQDRRRRPFHRLAAALWQRYQRPLCISETGHVGEGRAQWLDDIAGEVAQCHAQGIPLLGLCLYPLIDRPDWQDFDHWHHAGLWDVPGADAGDLTRRLCQPYAERLQHWLQAFGDHALRFSPPFLGTAMKSIVVFSHLRWDFVYQRPQQLMSRLAGQHPILFVEEPIVGAERTWLERYSPCAGVQVLRMHVPGNAPGFADMHMDRMRGMLQQYLDDHGIDQYLLWFYTPMALPLARDLTPLGRIYDCMDELSAFDFAPPALIEREEQLFREVDLVFTGGRSLYESKRTRHGDVHCFPSSVDHAHFGRSGVPSHPDQAHIAGPRLGYYGVIDERLDLDLVGALADAHPDWQIVMVGPVVKIDAARLPQRPNLHWMGQRRYDELPSFLSGWDVCLMPFALNASTRFISPTKTLEYLAAGKPVVSTPVRDVAQQYADVVPIAASPAEFVAACEGILARSPAEQAQFQELAAQVVASTSWDRTATAMQVLLERFDAIEEAIEADEALAVNTPLPRPVQVPAWAATAQLSPSLPVA